MLTKRSSEKEIIDFGPNESNYQQYVDCLRKLFRVSKYFGIFRDSVKTLKKFSQISSLIEIGCGGGLFLLHLGRIFPNVQMLGVDVEAEAIRQALQSLQNWQIISNVGFTLQKQTELNLPEDCADIILATLVCHHIDDLELINFFRATHFSAKKAVIINDLHRHFVAEFFYRLISPLLFQNRMITHDGLISIRRGFKYKEIKLLLEKAGLAKYEIVWRFPFRWQIIIWKD